MATKKAAKKPAVKFTKAQMRAIEEMFKNFLQDFIRPTVTRLMAEETKPLRDVERRLTILEQAFLASGGTLQIMVETLSDVEP